MDDIRIGPGLTLGPGLIIRPGDTLIIATTGDYLSRADVDRITAAIKERIPGLADVIIILQASALAAYRPDPEPKPPAPITGFLSKRAQNVAVPKEMLG